MAVWGLRELEAEVVDEKLAMVVGLHVLMVVRVSAERLKMTRAKATGED